MTPVEGFDRRRAFCARLKNERERRGTSLADIAEVTKIKASLLDALERADLSRWPKGIYRRAFFRDYASAIGLPADVLVGEFLDVFDERAAAPAVPPTPTPPVAASASPAAAAPVAAAPATGAAPPTSMRLTLAPSSRSLSPTWPADGAPRGARLRTAAVDLAAVAGCAGLLTLVAPVAFIVTALVIGAVYHLLAAFLGVSPAVQIGRTLYARFSGASGSSNRPTPGAVPYGLPLDVPAAPGAGERLVEAWRRLPAVRVYLERLTETRLFTLDRERQRELASMRRRRAEAANRSVDEVSRVAG